MSALSCDHSGHIDTDVSGRRVCTDCGEVLGRAESIVEDRFELSPEFQLIPKLSEYGEAGSQTTNATIDAVCDQCEKVIGTSLAPDLKQRVMQLVESYRLASGVRQLYSYENTVRTAMLVVLRASGYAITATQLIPRFDEKRTPMFRLLSRMQSVMGVRVESLPIELLVSHVLESLLKDLGDRGVFPNSFLGRQGALIADHATVVAVALLKACVEFGAFPAVPKLSQAVAGAYMGLRFGCEFPPTMGKRDFTLKSAIAATSLTDSDKAIYRDFDCLRDFILSCLLQTGFRDGNERTFFSNFDAIVIELRKRAESRRRISEILDQSVALT